MTGVAVPTFTTEAGMNAKSAVHVIAGDIGGTKTLLQLVRFDPAAAVSRGEVVHEQRFDSRAHTNLAAILRAFLDAAPSVGDLHAACLGVAGPVQGDADRQFAQLTNLPWNPDSKELAQALGLRRVRLINDFQAVGYGIDALTADDRVTLQAGALRAGAPRLVLGAGTGLGVALMFWNGRHYDCVPTEGGHGHFAPVDAEQDALLGFLRREFGRVSNERLVSGPGLINIYRFLCSRDRASGDPLLETTDPAAAIAAAADAGDGRAEQAMDLFVRIYGAVAGDLALTCLAEGGVYIGGGIAPKILPRLQRGPFLAAFRDKARMRPLLERMPVEVIVNPHVPLYGTALAATRL